ncbi:uncharacterized protein JCM15063_004644 [Sporobolomyces koalae]|uniref:uncharacterized protein n=1 Tax=Sporobolomyces koalae TaxID=500713 RepID=UPI0031789804
MLGPPLSLLIAHWLPILRNSIQVVQQLASKRSLQALSIVSSPSLAAIPIATSPTLANRSLIPRLTPTAVSRSPSPEVPIQHRNGSVSSSRSLSKIPSPVLPHSSPSIDMARNHSADSHEADWETLQVSPTSDEPFPSSSSASKSPSMPTTPTPRKRAQTDRTRTSPTTITPRTNTRSTASTRKPYANRTNNLPASPVTTGTTATPKKTASSTPARRKSLSSTPRTYSAYDLSRLPPDAFASSTPVPAVPSWSTSAAPQVFRNSKGELESTGREEDRVLPTVARRIESERLKQMLSEGVVEDVLIDEWGTDGTPRSRKDFPTRSKQNERDLDGNPGTVEEEPALEPLAPVPESVPSTAPIASPPRASSSVPPVGKEHVKEEQVETGTTERVNMDKLDQEANKASCCGCIIC